MSTHIEGVCPLHIYVNRRPLESQNPYAIEYRVNNYQPLTKDAFDRALNGIIENCQAADIGLTCLMLFRIILSLFTVKMFLLLQ